MIKKEKMKVKLNNAKEKAVEIRKKAALPAAVIGGALIGVLIDDGILVVMTKGREVT